MLILAPLSLLGLSAAGVRSALLPRSSSITTLCLSCPYHGPGGVQISTSVFDTVAGTLTCDYQIFPSPPAVCTFSSSTGALVTPSDTQCAPATLAPVTYVCPASDGEDPFAYNAYDTTTDILHCGFYTSSELDSLQECTYNSEGMKLVDFTDFTACPNQLTQCTATVTMARRAKNASAFSVVQRRQLGASRTTLKMGAGQF